MTAKTLTTVANELIETYGNTAKNVINAYRVGNQRAIDYLNESWSAIVEKNGASLSTEIRDAAITTQQKLADLYGQGIALTSDSADLVVDKTMELAEKGVQQIAINASRFEQATGVMALNTLADAAIPAAQAVTKAAVKLEAQSGALANKIAGSESEVKIATVKRASVKKKAPAATKTKTTAAKPKAQSAEAAAA